MRRLPQLQSACQKVLPTLSPCVRGLLSDIDEVDAKILAACNNADKDSSAELGTGKEPNFDHDIVDQSILLAAGPASSHHEDITAAADISTKLDFIENLKEAASENQGEQGKVPNFAMGAYLDDYVLHQAQSLDSERKRPSTRRAPDQDHAPAKKRKKPEADTTQLSNSTPQN